MPSLYDFIADERRMYADDDNNRFAFALGQAARYEGFLAAIRTRHGVGSVRFRAAVNTFTKRLETWPQNTAMDAELSAMSVEQHDASSIVHLDIESFYLFAKIYLDHLARFVEFYFGAARGCALDSHDNLAKRFERFARHHGLTVEGGLIEVARRLKDEVADYRDYQIAHSKSSRRFQGTTWAADGEARIVSSNLYPKENDEQIESRELSSLAAVLDEYLRALVGLIQENRARSRLKLQTPI